MNILLLGYRGSGKSTLGKLVAAQTWKDFVDLDPRVTAKFDGRSIADIWQHEGEAAFRAAEVQTLAELLENDDQVIALGGGTVMQPAAAALVAELTDARRVYLHCKPEVLAQRIAADPASAANRPALLGDAERGGGAVGGAEQTGERGAGGGHAADLAEITAVLADREPTYRRLADVVFDVTHVTPADAAAYLVRHHL